MSHQSDFLIIGSGIAGLSFALRAAEYGSVIILTKKNKAESNTNYAQGGIASVFSPDDSFDKHVEDTLTAGVGLCHQDAVSLIVHQAPERIRELLNWGVHFTAQEKQKDHFDLGREGGHTRNRIVHVKDYTGRALESALLERVKEHPNIQMLEDHVVIEFITEHHIDSGKKQNGRRIHCYGVYALNIMTKKVDIYQAKVTLLSSGGSGKVYLHTTNPVIATGDGVAMAYRAGAYVANMEFMQFHPTMLFYPDEDSFLISEAVRGFGGILRTMDGNAFMKDYHYQADLAPRDVVARAIDAEMKKRGDKHVLLDVSHLNRDEIRNRFPQINERLLSLKIDMTKEPIPVVPAAHYMCGGVLTDLEGKCNIEGLWVTGEVACTGVHGSNRLASNSLLEALVFSHQAFESALKYIKSKKIIMPKVPRWNDSGVFDQHEWVMISHDQTEIQRLMWNYVGIVRNNERLHRAFRRVSLIQEEIEIFYKRTRVTAPLLELRNLASVAMLIIRSAMFRKESRGLHYNTDFPDRDDRDWLGDTVIQRKKIYMKRIERQGSLKKKRKM